MPDQTIITGSFSKVLSPGMRLGWVVAPPSIMEQLVIAKQAADLHSNYLSQRIAYEYLRANDIGIHIKKIREAYRQQCETMITLIEQKFPETVSCTHPLGGMFVWVTLPEGYSLMEVFNKALQQNVAVLPGLPFYVNGGGTDTLRLNFSNATCETIQAGMERLALVIKNVRPT